MKKYLIVLTLAALLPAFSLAACKKHDSTEAEPPELESPLPGTGGGIFDIPNFLPEVPPKNTEKNENEAPMPETPVPKTASYVLVKTNGLNVRSGAGTGYAALGQVEKGVLLPLSEREGNWYRTEYRGKTAYVSAEQKYTELFTLECGEDSVEKVIAEGSKLLGTPYVYGAVRYLDGKGNLLKGFTNEKFDCSSLMQYIFYRGAGIVLDVTTRTQIVQGTHVQRSDIQRGDLLFFTNASRKNLSGIERVGHVALYLGGNYILHTSSDYAKIEQISSTRWSYFIEARRMF